MTLQHTWNPVDQINTFHLEIPDLDVIDANLTAEEMMKLRLTVEDLPISAILAKLAWLAGILERDGVTTRKIEHDQTN